MGCQDLLTDPYRSIVCPLSFVPLANQSFEEKIAKVGELIRPRQKIKAGVSEEAALLASLDKVAAELNAGKGVPIERVRENIREWATSPKNSKK